MLEVVSLGLLLGIGAALSVGPIFVTILQEAARSGFTASLRVILGSAVADLVLMVPALAFTWVIKAVASASLWISLAGGAFFVVLAVQSTKDSYRLWKYGREPAASQWAFLKGMASNLANPMTWTFWLAVGTPTMYRSLALAGAAGLALFTIIWFGSAVAVEATIAYAIARSGKGIGARGQAIFSGVSALLFTLLATTMIGRYALPLA